MEYLLIVLWLAVFLLLGYAAAPVTTWLCGPRGGAGLSFAFALVVLTAAGHLVGHLAMGLPAALAGVVVLAGLSALATRDVTVDVRRFGEASAVFVAGFLLIVAIRGVDPAAAPLPIAIGEKFLDFGLLSTLDRSSTLPPEDMWFAGEHVVYHYGGHLATELVSTLTGTGPRFAYNLGLAAFYATLVAGAYGLAAAVAGEYDVSTRVAGMLGAFFVGVAANFHTAVQFASWVLPDGVERTILSLVGSDPGAAGWNPSEIGANWYFDASRVIPVDPTVADPSFAATEFPLFAWLNGDLHAHMMSQPAMLLAAGLLFGYWRRPDDLRRRRLILFGALPVVAGVVGITNVWSFPSVGGLVAVGVLFAPGDPADLLPGGATREWLERRSHWALEEGRRVAFAVVATVFVLVIGVLWTLPFWVDVFPEGPSRSVEYWAPWTPLGGLLVHLGAFLFVCVPFVAYRGWATLDAADRILPAAVLAGVAIVLLGAPAVGIFGLLLVGAWWLLRTDADVGFETAMLVAGAGLVLLVEVLTIQGERFNVIFKPYVEVWLFLSIATAVVLARMVAGFSFSNAGSPSPAWRRAGTVLLAVLVVTTGLYAAVALPVHFETGSSTATENGPTLDATAFVEVEYAQEAAAIRWLDERSGQPTIVTAAPGGYWWRPSEGDGASAAASLTGLPTVLGWFHERQYRGAEPYEQRLDDVDDIFTGDAERQAALFQQHDVRYVYVGPAERDEYGSSITVADHPAVEQVFERQGVTIYGVERSELPDDGG